MSLPLVMALVAVLVDLGPGQAQAAPNWAPLEFNGGAGGIADSGFTTSLTGTDVDAAALALDNGALVVTAGSGNLAVNTPRQANALGIAYRSQDSYTVGARILAPQSISRAGQLAGIYLGQSQRNFIRLAASGNGTIQLLVNDNGKQRTSTVTLPAGTLSSATSSLDLFLTVEHSSNRLTALYRVNSNSLNDSVQVVTRNLPRWMRIRNANQQVQVLGGIIASDTTGSAMQVRYDWLRLFDEPVLGQLSGFKSVDKDGVDTTVLPGETLTYTISVRNNGAAGEFRVDDPIPAGTAYVSGSATATRSGLDLSGAPGRVAWQGTLNPQEQLSITFRVTVNQGALQSATITNLAMAFRVGSTTAPVQLSASTVIGGTPDLSEAAYTASPETVGPGGEVTYTLTLTNDGDVAATDATAQLSIPADAPYIAGSATATSGNLVISTGLRQILWSAGGPVAPGASVTISFRVGVGSSLPSGAELPSQATVDAQEVLPSLFEARAVYSAPTVFSGSKQVDKAEALPGDTLTYSFSLSNGGAAAALRLVDPLPADVTYVSHTQPAAGSVTYNQAARELRWEGSLGSGQTTTFTLVVQVRSTGLQQARIVNTATLSTQAGTSPVLLSAATSVRGVPSAAGSSYIAAPLTLTGNSAATFALNITNSGTSAATSASATLSLPVQMAYVLASGTASSGTVSYSEAARQLSWTSSEPLAPGAVVQVIFQARTAATLTTTTTLTSDATVQLAGAAPIGLSASVTSAANVGAATTVIYFPLVVR
jgi:uncharacterized repeat protein (TIGR01451 family)